MSEKTLRDPTEYQVHHLEFPPLAARALAARRGYG